MVIEAIGSALGGIFGGLFGKSDAERAQELRQQALGQFAGMSAPEIKEIMLGQYASQGELTPEAIASIDQAASKMEQIQLDPALRDTRLKALSALQEQGRTGLSASDRQALNETRLRGLRDQQAKQSQIMQNMAARGMAGSGQELAAALASSQAGAEEASAQGDRLAAMAQERALQATQNAGSLAGNIRESDMGEQSSVARAADEISRFNTANRQNVLGTNVGARNAAQAGNLQNKQNIANSNVDVRNQQEKFNKVERVQQNYDNAMRLASAKANALSGAATNAEAASQRASESANRAFTGLGSIGQSIWGKSAPTAQDSSSSTKLKAMLGRGTLS